ncbi:L-2-hydroxyglutarate oxidase [Salicibibacter halophilus]|uniref:L-2-hydroxyglutarate oxidase n=1 Tax=Salicibibacter halophilus TaxID=2502791 RepID=A0A514LM39_9BACI|nr:L-2-hydroxyglutarate oxidase [Salicibibacter halophilus]QDI92595.1 L-2-hydroxyglutarate oxidase [Salicibibacter halophilus]
MYDYIIIGGGIVGLSTSKAILDRQPKAKILILEKEDEVAAHQTGHNSGVIHSGIYYKPGSLKANFATAGNQSMKDFCRAHGIHFETCGKVIVATEQEELPVMERLYERGHQNGLALEKLDSEELKEIEPHVRGLAALRVPSAGIVDFKRVAKTLAVYVEERGGQVELDAEVTGITEKTDHVHVETSKGSFTGRFMINCAGLHSDRVARLAGYHTDMKIVPFRGEYYQLRADRRSLVNHLVYPVPNPDFPFLGVHFTRMVNGGVEAGPNAVPGLKREGYQKTEISLRDTAEVLTYEGFWRIARQYAGTGMDEMVRSFSKRKFVKGLQKLIPDVQAEDIVPAPAGVRAQALSDDGQLIDDFMFIKGKSSLHVCNAPSPAATASLEIGKEIVRQLS